MSKRYYMVCLELDGRDCLVVGGGSVAHEKAQSLLDCGAQVTVIARAANEEVTMLPVRLELRDYRPADLDGRLLAVAATSDQELNERISADARERGVLINVVDAPELCSFILPAVYRCDPIAIAVSTGGASPTLAKRIRSEIAERYGSEYAELARSLEELRPWAKERFESYEARKEFFEELVERALEQP